jgi:hypothetical protein
VVVEELGGSGVRGFGARLGNAERSFWMSAIFVTIRKLFLAWELGKLVGEFRAHVMRR